MRKYLLILAVALATPLGLAHAGALVSGTVVEKQAQSVGFTQDLDVADMDRLSLQAIYSDGTPALHNLTDGVKATAQLTVVSTTGINGAVITVNGVTVAWSTAATTALVAQSISSGIVNAASLSGVVTSSHAVSVVYATASLVGINLYSVTSSVPTLLRWENATFIGGTESAVSIATDTFSRTSHGLTTGMAVSITTTTGSTPPTGLTGGGTYYAIRIDANIYRLATSTTNAANSQSVNITALTGSGTFIMRASPLTTAANNGFKWQASNDGTNFGDLSISSVTYSAAGSTLWDFQFNNYRYLRVNFVAPATGGIALTVKMNGRKAN